MAKTKKPTTKSFINKLMNKNVLAPFFVLNAIIRYTEELVSYDEQPGDDSSIINLGFAKEWASEAKKEIQEFLK